MTRALTEWSQELRDGKRTPTIFDDLWRAACEAMNASDCLAMRLPKQAEHSEREANRLLKSYHKSKKRERDATRDGFEYL